MFAWVYNNLQSYSGFPLPLSYPILEARDIDILCIYSCLFLNIYRPIHYSFTQILCFSSIQIWWMLIKLIFLILYLVLRNVFKIILNIGKLKTKFLLHNL